MITRILVPLDGSQRAEAVLNYVEQLAGFYTAKVILLQVFELPHRTDLSKEELDQYEALPKQTVSDLQEQVDAAEKYLQAVVDRLAAQEIDAHGRVAYGPIASTILKTAEQENADLIAMASHGCGGLQGVYYGSVAAGVLQRVDRPLFIVRSDPNEELAAATAAAATAVEADKTQ